MPAEIYGEAYEFLPREDILTFEELTRLIGIFAELGITKLRITGGEPLLRPDLQDLVSGLKRIGVETALTTNASLLAGQADRLAAAGLDRVTVSLDALDPEVHTQMTDSNISVETVLDGIEAAVQAGLSPVKINCVVQKGVNEGEIASLVRRFRGTGVTVRFIEYMDVGRTNGWQLGQVVPSANILEYLQKEFDLIPVESQRSSDVARRWAHSDGSGEIGFISSVSDPFCGDCVRARISADGRLHTCLFASGGHDLRAIIHNGADGQALTDAIAAIWSRRDDRYSEIRSQETSALPRVEMSYIGG